MRVPTLLVFTLLSASLLCGASDQSTAPSEKWLVAPSGRSGYLIAPWADKRSLPDFVRKRMRIRSQDTGCLMLRTYIVVRESKDSDVTRRDGYFVCQPGWKFEVRTAVGSVEDR